MQALTSRSYVCGWARITPLRSGLPEGNDRSFTDFPLKAEREPVMGSLLDWLGPAVTPWVFRREPYRHHPLSYPRGCWWGLGPETQVLLLPFP